MGATVHMKGHGGSLEWGVSRLCGRSAGHAR